MTTTFERITRRHPTERTRAARATLATVPIVIASSLALSLNLSGPIALEPERTPDRDDATPSPDRESVRESVRAAFVSARADTTAQVQAAPVGAIAPAMTPSTYTVQAGDTVSGIAGRFGLSTASVLAMNGLGWKSVIHPGQVLVLAQNATATPPVAQTIGGSYTIVAGDTVSGIAARHGVSASAILTANGLTAQSIIYPGQTLAIPSSAPAAVVPSTIAPSGVHLVSNGETVTSIAETHGVSLGALLAANGLSLDSTIFAGQSLVVPGAPALGAVPASADTVVPMTAEMAANARTIVGVGRSLGVPEYGLVIALAAAAQESTLRNLDWGDLDSVGLFQQRPSAGWGSVQQLTTPEYSARLFYGGPGNPNAGNTRGLLDIPGWQSMTVTEAAQAVQISAFPDAYAKWETSARAWLAQIG